MSWQDFSKEAPPPEPIIITAKPFVWRDPKTIPVREWLYGHLLIRKFVTATVSPGGIGKSSLAASEALAQVTGRDLLGVTPAGALCVWLWNLEDPEEETERKLLAAAMHHKIKPEEAAGRLHVDGGHSDPLVIARSTRDGAFICEPVVDALVTEILNRKVDVITIDPFVSSHQVPENDNGALDMVVKEWCKVAQRGNCAVHLIDHTRKMGVDGEVTTESARGAKAKTDACRVVRAVNRMTKEEGEKTGVENHRLYFRTYNDKANLQPPADKSEWFKLESVSLGNGPLGGAGDNVGVVTKWDWPDPTAGITGEDFDKVSAAIRRGTAKKTKWRKDIQARDWVGKAIGEALGLSHKNKADKSKINGLQKFWLSTGALQVIEDFDENRETRDYVVVSEESGQ